MVEVEVAYGWEMACGGHLLYDCGGGMEGGIQTP